MAVRTPVLTPVLGGENIDGWQVVWSGLLNGDTGAPVGSTIGYAAASAIAAVGGGMVTGFADKSVHPSGTFGSGGTVAIEGSNDGTNFFVMNDPFAVPLNLTNPNIHAVTEAVVQVRPHVTGGDGTTNLTITMLFRKTQFS